MTGAVVISGKPADWDPWYTSEPIAKRSFYWDGYRGVLEDKGWSANAVGELERTTDEVVKRLANPTRSDPYQSKGLVVGHVQSGKTANFTGVIAKAIDAGYKLVIVLTGTIELLADRRSAVWTWSWSERRTSWAASPETTRAHRDGRLYRDGDVDWQEGRFVTYGRGSEGARAPWDPSPDRCQGRLQAPQGRPPDPRLPADRSPRHPARPLYHVLNIHSADIASQSSRRTPRS